MKTYSRDRFLRSLSKRWQCSEPEAAGRARDRNLDPMIREANDSMFMFFYPHHVQQSSILGSHWWQQGCFLWIGVVCVTRDVGVKVVQQRLATLSTIIMADPDSLVWSSLDVDLETYCFGDHVSIGAVANVSYRCANTPTTWVRSTKHEDRWKIAFHTGAVEI
jgi:hypothetical protein